MTTFKLKLSVVCEILLDSLSLSLSLSLFLFLSRSHTHMHTHILSSQTNLLMSSSKGSLLPEFPDVKSIVLPYAFPIDRVNIL